MSSKIFQMLLSCRNKCMIRSRSQLISDNSLGETVSASSPISELHYLIFRKQFGNTVINALLIPENVYHKCCSTSTALYESELEIQLLSLTNSNSNPLPKRLSNSSLKSVLNCIHVSCRPLFQNSHASYAAAIVQSFRDRCKNLLPCTLTLIIEYIRYFKPHFHLVTFECLYWLTSSIVPVLCEKNQLKRVRDWRLHC